MRLIATCPEDTKDVLISELTALGMREIKPLYRAVSFTTDERGYYRAHLHLRTASRILRVLREAPAHGGEMLYSQARRVQWHELFDLTRTFIVEGVAGDRGEGKLGANEISKRVRQALQDVFWRKYGKVPKVDLKEPKVIIVAHVHAGRCTLSLDTSGKAMHKRGYRGEGHTAPIKETLAASLLHLAGYDGSLPLQDPMCGSGTIAIEAAMMALRKSPLIHRKKGDFQFEWLKDFNTRLWKEVQDEARAEQLAHPPAPIHASDISKDYVALARESALRARVEKHIHFSVGRIEEVRPTGPAGLLVANLPYGERLEKDNPELLALYKNIGDVLKQRYSGWRAALLAAEASPWKHIGLKPKRRISLMNGAIPCKLLIFELYSGTRKKRGPPEPATS